jgi:HD-like signal output (HDOD) protein/CheY-like chemotaxis protein
MSAHKIRILFVDDQPEILQGLKRMARGMRKKWDVSFAHGGEAALEMMANNTYDVLVTDMRMPGIDGSQLLQETLRLYPHMIRIVLSGQYDIDNFIRSGWSAHQFLSKPCDTDTLKRTITQTVAIRDLLKSGKLKELVTRTSILPSLPKIYLEIEQELNSPDASMQKVGKIIAQDVGITAKVLQLVNSPVFGCTRKIVTPEQAVVMLGVDVIKSLTLYLQTCSKISAPAGISLERISKHSIAVGVLARDIAKLEGKDKAVCSDAFMAGVLHSVGSLVILSGFPDEYMQVLTKAREENLPVWQEEEKILGANHAQVGAYLIGLWGLSPTIAEGVAYHNCPSTCPDENISFVLTALHVANVLEREPGSDTEFVENNFDFEYLKKLGLIDRLPHWQQIYQKMNTR